MTLVSSVPQAVKELAGTFGGQLLQAGDSGYEEARRSPQRPGEQTAGIDRPMHRHGRYC